MKISVLTLFPELITPYFEASIPGRGAKQGLYELEAVQIRDYTLDKHNRVDDYIFGGGPGMLMAPQPLADCIDDVKSRHAPGTKVVYLSPGGRVFNNRIAREYAQLPGLILLCGHYEGIDQRIIDNWVDEELSIGDFVLTGGELAAMAVADAVIRFIPGVIGNLGVHEEESFETGMLEYPQYTRPADFRGFTVPEVLQNGHHAKIQAWRDEMAEEKTRRVRPDLLENRDEEKQD